MNIFDPKVPYSIIESSNVLSIIETIRQGVKFSVFENFVNRSTFSLNEWSSFLHISDRTMQRYQREKRKFEPLQSEKIIEIMLIYKKGIEVFGSEEKFNLWLNSENIYLGKTKPKEFLDNSFGLNVLKDELTKIEHGVLA